MLDIKRLSFRDFRNYPTLELTDLAHLVIVVGDNALGKTNIIEGVQLVSMMDSFRKPSWGDVVRKGADSARVVIEYRLNGCDNSIVLDVCDNARAYQHNEKPKSRRDLLGLLPAVLFTPDDLQIVQGPAERRRACVDDLGCQISRTYVDILHDYTRVVKQKNSLLREEYVDPYILDSWNRNLIKLGSSLMTHRTALFGRLMEKTTAAYHRIAPHEQLTATYVPSWKSLCDDDEGDNDNDSAGLADKVEQFRNQELKQRRTLVGPHRDEISFFLDGSDARRFGSQGQQRSIALATKIAEVEVLRDVTGADPILLLDDVMSEIDASRRSMLLDLIDATTQTLITTTNLGYFDEQTLLHAQVIRLPLEENDV